MLGGVVSETGKEVWGFSVPTLPNGRRGWPAELRAMAAEKVAAGAKIREIAEEIGAHQSLVSAWVKKANACGEAPTFIEVIAPTPAEATLLPKATAPEADLSDCAVSCQIRINDCAITIPPGYPAAHLAEVLRAVRASQ